MATVATVRVQNDLLPPTRLADVLVRVLQTDGTFVTEGITDVDGEAAFLLPDATYDLLFWKQGVSVVQPQRIIVDITNPDGNIFLVPAHVYTPPESPDPNLCRVSGSTILISGQPTRGLQLAFEPKAEIIVVAGELVSLASQLLLIPDEQGYFEFDLIRTLKYDVYFFAVTSMLGKSPAKIEAIVPDLPSISLDRLLFPVPTNFGMSKSTLALTVGDPVDDSVLTTVSYSDGNDRVDAPLWGSPVLTNTDGTVVEAKLLAGKLQLRALRAGTATITAIRSISDKAVWLPGLPAFTADSLVVTVT